MNHPRKEEDGVGRKSDKAGQERAMHAFLLYMYINTWSFHKNLLLTT
jgi:hypothetical protein